MNNRKQTKQPLFAEVNLTGDEFRQSPSTHMQRTRFLKLVYPNGVTLILPGDISASQLEQYIHIKDYMLTFTIFLCMEPVDMRKQFRGLQGIISEKYNRYLTQDEAFIFIGKTRTTAKILHRESNSLLGPGPGTKSLGTGLQN